MAAKKKASAKGKVTRKTAKAAAPRTGRKTTAKKRASKKTAAS